MDSDDRQIGRVLSRREALAVLAAASAAMLVGCGPSQTGAAQPTAPGLAPAGNAAEAATLAATAAAAGPNAEAATSLATAEAEVATPLATAGAETATAAATQAPVAAGTTALPTCIVSPEQTEGPYFVDVQLNRSDIRTEPSDGSVAEGVPLELALRVSRINSSGCTPLEGAIVDIWHCDAAGVYSGVNDRSQGANTVATTFLRGYQTTDASGIARFTTIYPGWYRGRAVHIHFKVRTDPASTRGAEFTSQLYFDEAVTDKAHAQPIYAGRGQRDTPNARDGIYRNGGDQLTLSLTESGQGYASTFDIGLQMA